MFIVNRQDSPEANSNFGVFHTLLDLKEHVRPLQPH